MDDNTKLRILAERSRAGDSEAIEHMISWLQDIIDGVPVLPMMKGPREDVQQVFQIHGYAVAAGKVHIAEHGEIDVRALVSDVLLMAGVDGVELAESTVRRVLKGDRKFILKKIENN